MISPEKGSEFKSEWRAPQAKESDKKESFKFIDFLDNTTIEQLSEISPEIRQVYKERNQQVEENVAELDIVEFAKEYGVDMAGFREGSVEWLTFGEVESQAEEQSHELLYFESDKPLPDYAHTMPTAYGCKGGAARALLERELGIRPNATPRDIDLLRFTEDEPEPGLDDSLARKMMEQDYEYGDGVEVVEDIGKYFDTRDLTVNEIISCGNRIAITEQGFKDTVRNIIRPTEYEQEMFSYDIGYKMQAKMLRFWAEKLAKGDEASIEIAEGEEYEYDQDSIPFFWIAVHLDRAFERGEGVAEEFRKKLIEKEQIGGSIDTVEELVLYLEKEMINSSFYFRNAPVEQYKLENKLIGMSEGVYENLPKFISHSRAK